MAWISVYQEVDGPKLRKLAKALNASRAEALGILNFLWFWGMNNADETGLILEADKGDIADAFSSATKIPTDTVTDALIETGWLDIDDEGRIHIHDWDTWQEQWYKAQRTREYKTESKRRERAAKRAARAAQEACKGEEPEIGLPETSQLDQQNTEAEPEEPVEPQAPTEPKEPVEPKKGKKGSRKAAGQDDEPPKVKYADFVSMREKDYDSLCKKYGKMFADECISILDNYKGSKNKKYADDYRAILSWVVDRCKERNPGLLNTSQNATEASNNPFERWGEDD